MFFVEVGGVVAVGFGGVVEGFAEASGRHVCVCVCDRSVGWWFFSEFGLWNMYVPSKGAAGSAASRVGQVDATEIKFVRSDNR